jgi:hypothetical protein
MIKNAVSPSREDEMRRVVGRVRRVERKFGLRVSCSKVLHPPRAPKRFKFCLGKRLFAHGWAGWNGARKSRAALSLQEHVTPRSIVDGDRRF